MLHYLKALQLYQALDSAAEFAGSLFHFESLLQNSLQLSVFKLT
jgi:hypothetical protein